MRVNIFQNNICSIDFETVDQVIDFIKKFNKDRESNTITISEPSPIKTEPFKPIPVEPWYNNKDFIISDPVPDPNVVLCENINCTTTNDIITTK